MAAITTFKRAKIFQPFDALPGLREALEHKEREHGYLQGAVKDCEQSQESHQDAIMDERSNE